MSLGWLETYTSKSTVRAYKWALEGFFKSLGFKATLEENAKAYFSQKRNYEEDLKAYFVNLKGKPPKTVNICLTAAKMFLMENGVELSALFWRRLKGRRKGSKALMIDKAPSNAELRRILSHMDIKGKSLFLVLASSGMRIGETLKLKVEDLDLTSDPARINIRGEYTKSGNPRIAFISFEAKEALEEWLKIREGELDIAVKRSTRHGKAGVDRRIWPFETNTAYYIWRSSIKKARFDKRFQYNTELENNKKLERFTVHPHVLRKFFRTKMGQVIPVDVTEALMGHEGYLTEVYRRYSLEDLAKYYKEGEHTLLVFAESENVSKLKEEQKQLQTLVNGLTAENMSLKAEVNALKEKLSLIDKKQLELSETTQKLIEKLKATHPEWITEA